MQHRGAVLGIALCAVVSVIGCGGQKSAPADDLSRFFPDRIEAAGLQRGDEIRTFVGDSLWQYINGGAELYHTYGFVKVSTADYQGGGVDLVLDLYQFKTDDGAYGLYSALRPDQPALVTLGAEGYKTASSLEFVRGNVMARIIGYESSEAVTRGIDGLAAQVAAILPGTTNRPAAFALFPDDNAVPNTDKIIGAAFLGQSFLNMVYTRDYSFDGERVTLFLVHDSLGAAFAEWLLTAGESAKAAGQATALAFDENHALLVPNNYYGNVLAGLKSGYLAGAINYTDRRLDFVAGWIGSLAK